MKLAYIVFDGITLLDLIGIYDPVSRLKSLQYIPDLSWDICSFTPTVHDKFNFEIKPGKINESLAGYDALIVPGGWGTRQLQTDAGFLSWLKTGEEVPLKCSICSGSLLLGAAGFLTGKTATTHFGEYDALRPYCKEVSTKRVVEDGNIITAGAVAASIDLGLYLCNKWAGKKAEDDIRLKMNYAG